MLLSREGAYDLTETAQQLKADIAVLEAALNARPVFVPKSFRPEIAHSAKVQRERLERNWARKLRIAARAGKAVAL